MSGSPAAAAASGAQRAIARYLDVSVYLLLFTGFAAVASTGRVDIPAILFVLAALLARGWLLLRNRDWRVPERWMGPLALAYMGFYALDLLLLSANFVLATVHLVLFNMVVKLFSVRRGRDYAYLAVLAFLMVLAAAVLTVDTVFLASFVLFVFLAITTFIALEMKYTASRAQAMPSEEPSGARRFAPAVTLAAGLLVVSILLGATVIFFVLPRTSPRYLSQFAPRSDLVSGFSDDVQLGKIGEIKRNNAVVMHVQVEGGSGHDLLWRGTSLSTFDGRRWYNPPQPSAVLYPAYGSFDLARIQSKFGPALSFIPTGGGARSLQYRVLMEPLGTNVFFLAEATHTLAGAYRMISIDASGSVTNDDRERQISRYEGWARIPLPDEAALRKLTSVPPPPFAQRYLQLPRLDARISELARQVTADAASDYERARRIERHLRDGYGYTLELPPFLPPDPVAHFLFERRRGHCEFFASAMTVMLRDQGIPARIVNGFRAGELNDITGSYIVRARDAHSWVEAFLPGYGWVSFDPTPPDPAPPQYAWSRLLLYVDAMREFWREWVVNYDFLHQRTLGQELNQRARRFADDTRLWFRRQHQALLAWARGTQQRVLESPLGWSLAVAGLLAGALALLRLPHLIRWWRNLRLARRPAARPRDAAAIWYLRMTRRLARRGWARAPAQTAEEFLAAISDPEVRAPVSRFTTHYERARFGHSAEDAARLPELYDEVEAATRR